MTTPIQFHSVTNPPLPEPALSPEQVDELTRHANRCYDAGLRRLTDRDAWIRFCIERAERHILTGD